MTIYEQEKMLVQYATERLHEPQGVVQRHITKVLMEDFIISKEQAQYIASVIIFKAAKSAGHAQ